jgi:cyanate permease
MSVNQIAIVAVPPTLGLLIDLTGSFTPAWALLSLLTVAALAVTRPQATITSSNDA